MMSRRSAEDLIRAGRVQVDGRVAVLGDRADPQQSTITIDGVPLPLRPDLAYVLLNKPKDVISTMNDPQRRKTVADLVAGAGTRLYPVGRLDADSEGLLLMTNDGTLANLITHPSNQVAKTYLARVEGVPGRAALRSLEAGVTLDDGPARAVAARLVDSYQAESLVEVVMAEGRKREVRRMLEKIGHPVIRLVRTAIGPLRDQSLAPGEWRRLSVDEVHALYAAAGATWQDAPSIEEDG
jgi:23S rRNA pseudouridine2605 synthase